MTDEREMTQQEMVAEVKAQVAALMPQGYEAVDVGAWDGTRLRNFLTFIRENQDNIKALIAIITALIPKEPAPAPAQ